MFFGWGSRKNKQPAAIVAVTATKFMEGGSQELPFPLPKPMNEFEARELRRSFFLSYAKLPTAAHGVTFSRPASVLVDVAFFDAEGTEIFRMTEEEQHDLNQEVEAIFKSQRAPDPIPAQIRSSEVFTLHDGTRLSDFRIELTDSQGDGSQTQRVLLFTLTNELYPDGFAMRLPATNLEFFERTFRMCVNTGRE